MRRAVAHVARRLGYQRLTEPACLHTYGPSMSDGGVPIGVGSWEYDEMLLGERWLSSRTAAECAYAPP
jgi:hypothetical protein